MSASTPDQPETQGEGGAALPIPPGAGSRALPLPTREESQHPPAGKGTGLPTPGTSIGGASAEQSGKFAQEAHQYIREYIRLADQKATFFFTGGTALLAFLYKNGVSERWLKPIMSWNILDTIAFLAMAALAVAAFLSLLVVIPRVPGSKRGYLFWEAIAEYESGRQYADELGSLSVATLFQIKAEHCFDLARVCRRKYAMLRIALWIGAVGLAASLLVFLFV